MVCQVIHHGRGYGTSTTSASQVNRLGIDAVEEPGSGDLRQGLVDPSYVHRDKSWQTGSTLVSSQLPVARWGSRARLLAT